MEENKIKRLLIELLAPQFMIFNLCFVYIGMLFAPSLTPAVIALITIAFVSARSAGVIMNRYVGREQDMANPKKAGRRVSLKMQKRSVIALFAIFSSTFIVCAYLLNTLSLLLAPLVLALFVVDPVSKSYTNKRHFWLGTIESIDVMAGYIGATGAFPPIPAIYVLMIGIILVGVGLDSMISIVHADFDREHKLKSFASTLGVRKALDISLYSHIAAAALIMVFAIMAGGPVVLAGAVISSAVLLVQHINVNTTDDLSVVRRVALFNTLASFTLLVSVAISAAFIW